MDYNKFKNELLQHVKSRSENAEIKNYTKNNSVEREGLYIHEILTFRQRLEVGRKFNPD